jgi:phage terminase large subunit
LIPDKLVPVFEPARGEVRYRCAYGGRGSGKSVTFAKLAALWGEAEPLRILCTREFQNSIRDSFYAEVVAAIEAEPFLAAHYRIGESFITGANGTEFIFKGLRRNISSIKSMARIDLCIVEEAEDVPEVSWRNLLPTIRAPRSEVWVIWNPRDDGSPVDKRFRKEPPAQSVVAEINWRDNPWFPEVLDLERRNDQRILDANAYAWIWEGAYRTISDALVLKDKFRVAEFAPGKGWNGPYYGADWGFAADPTALLKLWIFDRRLYVEHEAYQQGVELDHLPAFFDTVPGSREHVIRADNARPETISYLARQGFKIVGARKGPGSVEDGVAHLRGYEEIIIHPRCTHTAKEALLWSYKTDSLSGDVLPVLVDAHNHAWDAARYALEPLIRQRGDGFMAMKVAGL